MSVNTINNTGLSSIPHEQPGNFPTQAHYQNHTYAVVKLERQLNKFECFIRYLAFVLAHLTIIPAAIAPNRVKQLLTEAQTGLKTIELIYQDLQPDKIIEDHSQETTAAVGNDADLEEAIALSASAAIYDEQKEYREIVPGYGQLPVLSQTKDGFEDGKENCGYHSLKNALILMLADSPSDAIPDLLDEELFLEFYLTYCVPKIQGKEAGKKDADLEILNDIIESILKDESPPEKLRPLIDALREKQNNLAILHIGESQDALCLESIDSQGVKEAIKVYEFTKNPNIKTLTVLSGYLKEGHWYTLHFKKDETGAIEVFGCDSAGLNHPEIGTESAIYKMGHWLVQELQEPDRFFQSSNESLMQEMAQLVDLMQKGETESDAEHHNRLKTLLLDSTPNELMAVNGVHDGSKMAKVISDLNIAYESITAGNLTASKDEKTQKFVSDVNQVLEYYLNAED